MCSLPPVVEAGPRMQGDLSQPDWCPYRKRPGHRSAEGWPRVGHSQLQAQEGGTLCPVPQAVLPPGLMVPGSRRPGGSYKAAWVQPLTPGALLALGSHRCPRLSGALGTLPVQQGTR